jgi:sigma-B regulation protein RsbU (phosphoserine phosphatase)
MVKSILVVDDSSENRFIVSKCLLAEGYQVHELESGQDLINLGERILDFDLILLDVMMPGLNGFETCKIIKDSGFASQIPVVFLSAEVDEKSRVSGFQAGGVDYILKPFGRKELGMRIKSHLAMSGNFKAITRQNKKLSANLEEGASIQSSFLPAKNFHHDTLNIAWNYNPAEHIAGDMFGFVKFDDNSLGVYLLDVCGHGTSAALVASTIYGAINSNKEITGFYKSGKVYPHFPSKVMSNLNVEFPFEKFEKYFTFLYAVIYPTTKSIKISTAGHPPPFYLNQLTKIASKINLKGMIVGIEESARWKEREINYSKNDKLLFLSDGILEIQDTEKRYFESEIVDLVRDNSMMSSNDIVALLKEKYELYLKDSPIKDDCTIVCVDFL